MQRHKRVGDGKARTWGALAMAAALAATQLTGAVPLLAAEPTPAEAKAQKAKAAEALKQKEAEAKKAREAEAAAKAQKEAEAKKAEAARKEEERKAAEALKKQQDEDRRAAAILNEAKQAAAGRNFPHAINKYREFAGTFPKRPEYAQAKWGMAQAMVDHIDKDWNVIAQELQQVVELKDLPDRGSAHYWLGVALRITGEQMLDGARGAKGDAQKEQLAKATERLAQSAHHYSIAEAALTASAPKPAPDAKELPPALDLAAKARAEGAETLCKAGNYKEAAERAKPFVTDPALAKATQRNVGLLALGRALVELKDYPAAFAALAQLAPFEPSSIGVQARVLLARIKSETGERPEAAAEYGAIVAEYTTKLRKATEESLRNREAWRGKALEQRRAEEMVRGIPEYVLFAAYEGGRIAFDFGQFGEAQPRLLVAAQHSPEGEAKQKAQLMLGACLAQQKSPEAEKHLRPLESGPLGDQALLWIGRLQRSLADANNAGQSQNQYKAAASSFAKSAELAQKLGDAGKSRRGEALLEQADALVLQKDYKAAAPIYAELAKDGLDADRAEIAAERQIAALAKGGDLAASDAAATAFLTKYPKSMARPTALYWQAQNAYQQGVELAKKPETQPQAKQLQEKAAAQFQAVAEKYPESAQAGPARFGVGMSYYRRGDWEQAAKFLGAIAESDRSGELSMASYYEAEARLKTLPEGPADDALSAARLAGGLEQISRLLSGFVASNDNLPETPDAMLKLADVYQRTAALLADQQAQKQTYQSARETYEKLLQKFPKHPAFAQAVMDRARLIAAVGDAGGAINELNRFRNDAVLAKTDVAPVALVKLAQIMTQHGRAVDAAVMLEKARQQYEPALKADPAKAGVVAQLILAHGLALKESNKPKEALALFETVTKDYASTPEAAEASLASIQVRKADAVAKLRQAREAVAGQPLDKPVDTKVQAQQDEAVKVAADIAAAFVKHAERIEEKSAGSDLHVRTLRDAGSTWAAIGEAEVESVRRAKAAESLKKLTDRLAKTPPVGKSNSAPRPAELKLAAISLTPAEVKAREYYNKALEANPDSRVCDELRIELARTHLSRGEADPAIQLLSAALDKDPPQPQLEFLRVGLGHAYLVKGDTNAALGHAQTALADANHPVRAAAYLLKGVALLQAKNPGEAQQVLSRFIGGAEKYTNAGPVTEEGIFRLGQAFAASNAWPQSREAYERLLARFGASRFANEARFGIAWSLQQEKQFDRAAETFADLTRKSSGELAARAQMQVGLCRAEQKRWKEAATELLAVPATYDYAEFNAQSSLAAASALRELKDNAKAKEVLQRIVTDHPETAWAAEATKRIKEIQ